MILSLSDSETPTLSIKKHEFVIRMLVLECSPAKHGTIEVDYKSILALDNFGDVYPVAEKHVVTLQDDRIVELNFGEGVEAIEQKVHGGTFCIFGTRKCRAVGPGSLFYPFGINFVEIAKGIGKASCWACEYDNRMAF
jgi:hypothetical protein